MTTLDIAATYENSLEVVEGLQCESGRERAWPIISSREGSIHDETASLGPT